VVDGGFYKISSYSKLLNIIFASIPYQAKIIQLSKFLVFEFTSSETQTFL